MTTRSDEERCLDALAKINFADRYYALCAAHPKAGPDAPLTTQQKVISTFDRSFKFVKSERFFELREKTGDTSECGLNLVLANGVEAILVCKPAGRKYVGATFAMMAQRAKRQTEPAYKHSPPYPTPNYKNATELSKAIDEVLALYDEMKVALAEEGLWKP